MTLAIATPRSQPSATWLSLSEAARRADASIGHLARLCRDQWRGAGLAVQRPPEGGGKPTWFIREDADPSFAAVKFPNQLAAEFDYTALPSDQRDELLRKLKIVTAWDKCPDPAETFLARLQADGITLPRSTLYVWHSAWRASGPRGLIDGRSQKRDIQPQHAEFFQELEHWYLDEGEVKARSCYKLASAVARRRGWTVPAYRTACRHLLDLRRRKGAGVIHARRGPKAFDDRCAAYIERDYTRIVIDGQTRPMESNDIWCGDHHPCDVLCTHNGKLIRPWLTAWEDIRSRRIFHRFFPTPPNSSAVLLALRAGIMATDYCLPRFVFIDNGKDYDCWMLQGETKKERFARRRVSIRLDQDLFGGVFGMLQIGVIHAMPYNAKSKPVERFFGTFEDQFGRLQSTYTGSSPEKKPEGLYDRIDRGQAPTFEDYAVDASAWIDRVYNVQEHTGQGMDGATPMDVYAANLLTRRTCPRDRLDAALLIAGRPVKVGRNGVQFDGRHYGQADPLLQPYFGQKVRIGIDPADYSRCVAWTMDGRRIGELPCVELPAWLSTGQEEWKEVKKTISRHNRAMKVVAEHGMRMHLDPTELLIENAARSQGGTGGPPVNPTKAVARGMKIETITPPLEPSKQKPILRPAVGAENIDVLQAALADEFIAKAPCSEPAIDILAALGGGED